jgi:Helix-turn-helix domain
VLKRREKRGGSSVHDTSSGASDQHLNPTRCSESFEPLINVNEAAKLIGGLHPKTLMRKARNGDVPGYQISRSWFFRASELDQWVRSLVTSRPSQPTPA